MMIKRTKFVTVVDPHDQQRPGRTASQSFQDMAPGLYTAMIGSGDYRYLILVPEVKLGAKPRYIAFIDMSGMKDQNLQYLTSTVIWRNVRKVEEIVLEPPPEPPTTTAKNDVIVTHTDDWDDDLEDDNDDDDDEAF
jgi:hypothetical protein